MALLDELSENAALFSTPIAGAKPAGNDPSYEPEFERVKAEIDKLTALSGGTPVWDDVIAGSERLLQEKAKDLRLCVWSSVGQLRRSGVLGLARGMVMTSKLCSSFWEGMYPDRPRARANLVAWLSEQASTELMALDPTADDRPALEVIETVYGELDTLLSDKLGQAYPGMGGLRSAVREKLRQAPQAAPPAPPPPAVSAAPVAAAPPPAVSAAPAPAAVAAPSFSAPEAPTVTDAEDAINALRAVGKTITSAAKHLRKADPADVWPYRLQRTGAWLAVRTAPPVEGKATRIPAPPAEHRKRLEAQLAEQQWLVLLTTAEDLTGTFLFWFDLHRFVALAMDRLGVQFAAAREALGREVVAFVTRNPTLPKLTFADGTPFADSATETWLAEETQKWAASGAPAGPSAATAEDEELAQRFEEARELVVGGKVAEGLTLAVQLASRGADARTRFRARLSVAKLAISGGKPDVARPILEGLLAEADRHQLEDWEPELCASLLSALFLCRKATSKPGPEEDSAWSAIFGRLCRLDPAAALRLSAG
ncbi:MAG TPA: type VI secretion system protein TssA [Polyangiaceae bacterium]|nr:type VI secretion system protein TssA [Polyangiaceae bacterium]